MQANKRQAYLAAMGWTRAEIEALMFMPVRQAVEQVEIMMCESGEARRLLREVTIWFPEAKVVAVREW